MKINDKTILFKKIVVIVFFVFCISCILAYSLKMFNVNFKTTSTTLKDYNITGYEVHGNDLVSTTDDSNIEYVCKNTFLSTIKIVLDKPLEQDANVTIYFNTGTGYSENIKTVFDLHEGQKEIDYFVLNGKVDSFRIDLGKKTGQIFSIKEVVCNGEKDVLSAQKRVYNNKCFLKIAFACFIVIAVSGIAILIYFFSKKKISLEKLGFVLIVTFGLVYVVLLTPLSSPDEDYHYRSAYKLSNVMMFKFDQINSGNSEHFNFEGCKGHYNVRTAYNRIATDMFKADKSDGTKIDLTKRSDSLTFPLFYVPQALGITIGRLLNFNMIGIFYLGRIFNLLFFAIMSYYAIKTIPRFKMAIMIILLLPMTMQQAGSYSYDAYINCLAVLLVAFIVDSMYRKDKFTRFEFIRLLIVGVLLAPAKIIYISLLILLFLIPLNRFKNKKDYLFKLGCIFFFAGLSVVGTEAIRIVTLANKSVSSLNYEGCHNYPFDYIFTNPISTLKIYINTFVAKGFWYVRSTFGAYLSGLTMPVNMVNISLFELLFCVSCLKQDEDEYKISIKQKILLLMPILIVIALVMYSMMIDTTSDFRTVIEGVQGRYFIPIMLPLAMVISNKAIVFKKNIDSILVSCCVVLQIFVIYDIIKYTFAL